MSIVPVEKLFTAFNETADMMKDELSCTYLEALAETGENLFQGKILQDDLSEWTYKRLEKLYSEIKLAEFSKEEIRKAFQLAILKGMKENVQPNHQMTPDSVGMFIGYLVNKFVQQQSYRLLDPAVGTGNLLSTVLNHQLDKNIVSLGSEIDDILIKLAYVNANLQTHEVELFNQDTLEPLFIDPVDAVICDLPVGYYPNDIRAAGYEIHAKSGHTYAHHLFIEQSTNHTKDGGYLFFLIPNGMFESEQSVHLHEFIKEHVYIQGIVQLPLAMFKNKTAAKSILILQKKAPEVKPPKQALLVDLPKLSDGQAMNNILTRIDRWFEENKR
ncbi:site-specific DNA-methyltransferase (adenine-specific) [Mesobacillus persicus]|uniref:Site-specific DNA-methyltransferase (Adenine-specific) n=1 Tax=Mesobacillus persicus TaxID=930146 RepID=A0A1H7XWP6_9BACI|nr:class I SAM-dependent methyltransferase [Mesobacillus persicus]SEM38260.1 site-specific DNA-methyltransferase (adenine-specific) [Mesobacillus persicus]